MVFLLSILFALSFILPSVNGLMGYDISARVNDSSLEIHRSIQDMKFDARGLVNGFGNFSRFSSIDGFAGVRAHELSSSPLAGRIGYADQMVLRTGEGPVQITAKLQSNVIYSDNIYSGNDSDRNESQKIAVSEYGKIDIDEKWKNYFAHQKRILYSGPGIRVRETYENNGDYVKSSLESWELSRGSIYRTALNRTLISANLTSQGVNLEEYSNKSTVFLLNHSSVGRNTHIDIGRIDHSDQTESRIIEDYSGQQNITLSLSMGDWIMKLDDDREWLDCCRMQSGLDVTNNSKKQIFALTGWLDHFCTLA